MQIQNVDTFLEYLDKVHQRTMRVVRCIPAETLDWSYAAGKFTLGDLVRHMAARPDLYLPCHVGCGHATAVRPDFGTAAFNLSTLRPVSSVT